MKIEIKQINGEKECLNDVNRLKIEIDGVEYRLSYSKIYGLIINKVSISDNKEDAIIVQPRTVNEIIIN